MYANPRAEVFGFNITFGTLLAELSLHRPLQNILAQWNKWLTLIVAPTLIITGLYLGSYPAENPEWMPWSQQLFETFVNPNPMDPEHPFGSFFVPAATAPGSRLSTVGVQFCALAIFLSPLLRDALSHPWLMWLGHHSFAVYLVHGTILRTVGMWIVYGYAAPPWEPPGRNEDGSPRPEVFLVPKRKGHVQIAVVVFTALTYLSAWAWMKYVDRACARATQWLESFVFKDDDEDSGMGEKVLPR
jgi:peptidoglycan/LPS O-acetylase OafA/YrhL